MPTVLAIIAPGFEELEAIAPIDLLRRAGAEVTVASLENDLMVVGKNALALRAETTLDAVGKRQFDLLFLPGGPGVKNLRGDSRVRETVLAHDKSGAWLAAICAAPTVLNDAGLLDGRRYTAHFSVASELSHILGNERTVADGRILTSRGAGTATDFGLLLIEKLFSKEKAREVAQSVCA